MEIISPKILQASHNNHTTKEKDVLEMLKINTFLVKCSVCFDVYALPCASCEQSRLSYANKPSFVLF